MNAKLTQSELMDEVTRYLATVELFRSLGCEPRWRPETAPRAAATESQRHGQQITSAH
jgi:hypothetical protein